MARDRRDLRDGYDGREVLVTGADGFVGSHLCERLLDLGARVHALVRASSSGQLANISGIRRRIVLHRTDLSDPHAVRGTLVRLRSARGLIIFHLAAQAHVGESWLRPQEIIQSNILGTLNLLQACVDLSLDLYRFDTAGTSEEYGNPDQPVAGELLLHERSPINPKSIYATSKLAQDFLTMNFFDGYGLPGVTTRMFNNYGPRQSPRFVTGTIITQALHRKEVQLGNLDSRRDFCYVTDGVEGHLHAALWGNAGEVYVYGYGENISIGDWARLILDVGRLRKCWPERRLVSVVDRFRPGRSDVEELKVGYAKLHKLTGWKPQVSWEEGVARTIDWYAGHPDAWRGRIDWDG